MTVVAQPSAQLPSWQQLRRVLAVRLDNMGDVLMMSPALAAIKESLPQAELTLLASPSGAALHPHLPFVDRCIPMRAPWVKSAPGALLDSSAHMLATLIRGHFDAAIIFNSYTQSPLPAAMLCEMAGIKRRLAYCHQNPYALLTDWVPDPDQGTNVRHEVERQLALVAHAHLRTSNTRLRFNLRAEDINGAHVKLRAAGIDPGSSFVVMHPGATAPSRRYPEAYFGVAARMLTERLPLPIVLTGGADEAQLVAAVRAHAGPRVRMLSLAGRLTLGELGAVIDKATLLISNNSGPVHIAAARGTPVVDLYALTNPQHTPWRVPSRVLYHDVPCRMCFKSECPQGHHDCLRKVTPQQVALAALELLTGVRMDLRQQPLRIERDGGAGQLTTLN